MISLNATLIIQIINFIFLMWFLNKFLFKPVLKILDERKNRIENDFRKAKELEEKIKEGFEKYNMELENAKSEGANLKLKARDEATKVLNEKIEKAKMEANNYLNQFKQEMEKNKKDLKVQLEKDIENLAKTLCSTLLGREI